MAQLIGYGFGASVAICVVLAGLSWGIERVTAGRARIRPFQSLYAGLLAAVIVLALIGLGLAYGLYALGDCLGGLKAAARCKAIPNSLGQMAYSSTLALAFGGPVIAPWLALVSGITEYRKRKAL